MITIKKKVIPWKSNRCVGKRGFLLKGAEHIGFLFRLKEEEKVSLVKRRSHEETPCNPISTLHVCGTCVASAKKLFFFFFIIVFCDLALSFRFWSLFWMSPPLLFSIVNRMCNTRAPVSPDLEQIRYKWLYHRAAVHGQNLFFFPLSF